MIDMKQMVSIYGKLPIYATSSLSVVMGDSHLKLIAIFSLLLFNGKFYLNIYYDSLFPELKKCYL